VAGDARPTDVKGHTTQPALEVRSAAFMIVAHVETARELRMRRIVVSLFAFCLIVFAVPAAAQPGPEHKKLDALVGRWNVDIDVKATATTPASKASGSETCEWFANLHVVCRAEATGAAGLYKSMRIISWVPALKQYTSYTVDSLGYASLTAGTAAGSTWTFATELAGYKLRTTVKTSANGYTSSSEYAGADGKWVTSATVTGTRAK
jgi:hypothetical protein